MAIRVLEPDEEIGAFHRSTTLQHIDTLSVLQHGAWVPISFDSLDYIDCGRLVSHRAIVTDVEGSGYIVDRCTYYSMAGESLEADDPDGMMVHTADEQPDVFWRSSISQKKNTLSVLVRGEWVPIVFDSLDYITCDDSVCRAIRPVSHLAAVTDGDDIGFDFPVGECHFLSDKYVTHDMRELVTEELPTWFGTGTYQKFVEGEAYVNSDYNSLGSSQDMIMRIGKPYALAKNTLQADED